MHSYREIWAVSSGGGVRNLRRHGSPNENLAQTSHGRGAGLQPYKFTGKELETTHGQCLYDFGARWLDPLLPRWTSTDPLAEAYYHISPYAYCAGNPVSFVDPDGMDYFRTFSGALIWRNTHEESRIEDGEKYYNIGNSYILVNHGQSMIYFFRNNSLVGNWSFSEWNGPLPDAPHWQSNPCGSRDEAFIQGTGRYADSGANRFHGNDSAGGGGNAYGNISTATGLLGLAADYAKNGWTQLPTNMKSKLVYESKKHLRNKGLNIKTKNAVIYRKVIPNGLDKTSKFLGRVSLATNALGNGVDISQTGQIGLGHAVDMGLAIASSIPGWGVAIALIYMGVDYGWTLYSGRSVRDELNDMYSIKFR